MRFLRRPPDGEHVDQAVVEAQREADAARDAARARAPRVEQVIREQRRIRREYDRISREIESTMRPRET